MILEVNFVTLEQSILNELRNINLNGITISNVVCQPLVTEVTFEMAPAVIKFIVDSSYQYQVVSVNYGDTTYSDAEHLTQFNTVVLHLLEQTKLVDIRRSFEQITPSAAPISLVETMNGTDQARLNAVLAREKRIREFEQQLDLKEEEIKQQEQILYEKENAILEQRSIEEQLVKKKKFELMKKAGSVFSKKK